jgi:hypothetical protein
MSAVTLASASDTPFTGVYCGKQNVKFEPVYEPETCKACGLPDDSDAEAQKTSTAACAECKGKGEVSVLSLTYANEVDRTMHRANGQNFVVTIPQRDAAPVKKLVTHHIHENPVEGRGGTALMDPELKKPAAFYEEHYVDRAGNLRPFRVEQNPHSQTIKRAVENGADTDDSNLLKGWRWATVADMLAMKKRSKANQARDEMFRAAQHPANREKHLGEAIGGALDRAMEKRGLGGVADISALVDEKVNAILEKMGISKKKGA